jgi:hypothetical protein
MQEKLKTLSGSAIFKLLMPLELAAYLSSYVKHFAPDNRQYVIYRQFSLKNKNKL